MYWVDFPHDAYVPEFVNEHPGIIIRAANSLSDTCIILPVTVHSKRREPTYTSFPKTPTQGAMLKGGSPTSFVTRSEEHTSELQSLMRNSYAVCCLKKKITII